LLNAAGAGDGPGRADAQLSSGRGVRLQVGEASTAAAVHVASRRRAAPVSQTTATGLGAISNFMAVEIATRHKNSS